MEPTGTIIANVNITRLERQGVTQPSIQKNAALRDPQRSITKICRPIFAGFALLVMCDFVVASTYVVAKTGREVVVGADTRTTLTIDHQKHRPGPDRCKITKCSTGMYFVMSATPLVNIKTGIDFSRIANRACAVVGNVTSKADWFEAEGVQSARTIYRTHKQDVQVSATFFGGGMTGAFYSTRSFRYTSNGPYKEGFDCPAGCNNWTTGGSHDIMDGMLLDQRFFQRYGLIDGVRRLLREQISRDKTGEVGGPISIFRIDGLNDNWVESCPGSVGKNK